MMGNTPATDLRNAALVVEHCGWTQGTVLRRNSGEVCAVGAIELATDYTLVMDDVKLPGAVIRRFNMAGTGSSREAATINALDRHLRAQRLRSHVESWNDQPGRTPVQVARAMRRAADRWERENQPAPAPTRSELDLAGGPTK